MSEAETKRKFDADRGVRRHRQVPRHPGRRTTPRGCTPGWASRSRSTSTPTSSWPTRCSRSATGRSRRSAWRRCRRSASEGRTIFYVSHAAASVRKMCDRVLVLEKGVLGLRRARRRGHPLPPLRRRRGRREPEDAEDEEPTRSSAPTSEVRPRAGWSTGRAVRHAEIQRVLHELQVCSSGEPLAGPCDCCDIWYSCECRPHRSALRCREQKPFRAPVPAEPGGRRGRRDRGPGR